MFSLLWKFIGLLLWVNSAAKVKNSFSLSFYLCGSAKLDIRQTVKWVNPKLRQCIAMKGSNKQKEIIGWTPTKSETFQECCPKESHITICPCSHSLDFFGCIQSHFCTSLFCTSLFLHIIICPSWRSFASQISSWMRLVTFLHIHLISYDFVRYLS